MAVIRIAEKVARWFGYVVFGAIALGLLVALLGLLVAVIGVHVIS